jgi:hypothetical protein
MVTVLSLELILYYIIVQKSMIKGKPSYSLDGQNWGGVS